MTFEEFFRRWAARLEERFRGEFLVDLRAMVSSEQVRERRRLCTDQALYRRACEETAEEVRRYTAATDQERKISA